MKSKTLKLTSNSEWPGPEGSESTRDLAIDRLRGALLILMVIGDYLAGIEFVPSFLKHAPDIGFTIADVVAPAFIFVIGLNFGSSFARRSRESVAMANQYLMLRYLVLIGIGAIIAGGATAVGQPTDWGVLQTIGVAGLITLLCIRLPTWTRFAVATLMLVGYQYLLDSSMLATVLQSVHGGLFGSISWAALLVLSTAVADVWRKGLAPLAICASGLVLAAGLSATIVPVSKNRVSLSYILISLAISALVFLGMKSVSRGESKPAGLLCWWGQNSLAMYLLHLVVLAVFSLPQVGWWYVKAPVWLITIQLTAILALMSSVAWGLHRRPRT